MDLRVRHMSNAYRIVSPDPVAVAHGLDQVARHELPRSLDAVVPSVALALGLAPDAEVLVRHLRLRVRVLSDDVSPHELGAAWARALVEALAGVLEAAPLSDGFYEDDRVAVFPDRVRARACWLVEQAGGRAPWWGAPLFADGTPSAGVELASLASEAPWAAAEVVRRVVDEGLAAALGRWLGAAEAERLWQGVVSGWKAEATRQRGATGVRSVGSARAERVAVDGAAEAVHEEGARAESEVEIAEVAVVVGGMWAALRELRVWREALGRAPSPSHARLMLVAALARWAPAVLEHRGMLRWLRSWPPERRAVARARPGDEPLTASAVERAAVSDGPVREPERAGADAGDRAAATEPGGAHGVPVRGLHRTLTPRLEPQEARRGQESTVSSQVGLTHPVKAGGLVHLIRPVVQDGLLDALPPREVHERLLVLGIRSVDRLLDGLAPGARRAALTREAPMIAVFAGLPEVPSELHELVPPEAWVDWADAWLVGVAVRLPEDLPLDEEAARALRYGMPLMPGSPADERLAALLCRAGRLHLGPTHAEVHLPSRYVQLPLRRGGWDIDPGWIPHLGRVVRVRYGVRP
jgi:hypothetical protein